MIRPPRIPTRLLALAYRRHPAAAAILGDLHEDFARAIEARGTGAARLWYWREAAGLILGRLLHGLTRGALTTSRRRAAAVVEDGRYALRSLRRSPAFALFTALVIGVGVAAVTTVYSVLQPLALGLPFDDAGDLVWISNDEPAEDGAIDAVSSRVINLIDFRERAASFRGITGYDAFFASRGYTRTGDGEPERVVGVGVAHDFLDVLGIEPLAGRGFTEREGRPGGPAAAILAHAFWRTRFAADPDVVGRTLTLNEIPHTVVGVLPASFDFASVFAPGAGVELLVPFVVARDLPYQGNVLALIGRLNAGVSPQAAQAELDALLGELGEEEPERWGLGAKVTTLQGHLAGPFREALLLLAGAAATLLLIVCVNVAGLMLARAPARASEMAVRKALGASPGRLTRQLVLESLAVSLLGAAIGGGLATVATEAVRTASVIRIPLVDTARVDAGALAVSVVAAVLTGIAVGLVPALRVGTDCEASALRRARGGSAGAATRRLQDGLVVAEVGLASVLLVVVGLLMTSFRTLLGIDLGFEPADTVAWELRPSTQFASDLERSEFYTRLADRVGAIAGIESVGLVDALPLGRNRTWPVRIIDAETAPGERAFPHVVDAGYLRTLRISLRAGRALARADRQDSTPVVLLNVSGARQLFGGVEQALGRRLAFWGPWEWEVVGVVEDVRHLSPLSGPGTEAYFPLAQMPDFRTVDLVVRSPLSALEAGSRVSAALAGIDRAMPVRDYWTLEATIRNMTSDRRFALAILSGFGACALILAGLGIYGVLSRTVAERRPEIGIRMALGATGAHIVRDVVRRVLLLAAAGIGVGWMLSRLLAGTLEAVLYGVGASDPGAFLGTAGVLLAVAALAAALPARRAVATDASETLRAH